MANDIGQLLVLFPGMQLRSYGGLGGMKTVTFRSLGAGHTSVVLDNFALAQTQSGQTDLGQLPADFIKSLSSVQSAATSIDYPVHAKLAGQVIAIETRHAAQPNDSFQLVAGIQAGSFQQYDAHVFVGQQLSKWRFSLSGKGRMFEGDYPFTYLNGSTEVSTRRHNGDLKDAFGTAAITWSPTAKQEIRLSYSGAQFNKGLPGAVVFYNETAGQRLYGVNNLLSLRHAFSRQKWQNATTVSYQQNSLDYVDSNYLNAEGFLHSHYLSQQLEGQTQWSYSPGTKIKLLAGAGQRFEQLRTASFERIPYRASTDGLLAGTFKYFGELSTQLGIQYVNDQNRPISTRHTFAFLPMIDWMIPLGRGFLFSTGYRYTVRQPSFNELYYNQVGNDDLVPEKAHMAWIRLDMRKSVKNLIFRSNLQPFYVYATDKILAIPTKNLFIWSIQNVGKSQALGVECTQGIYYHFDKAQLSLNVNYTFQYTQDLSNPDGPTYGHILAYSPIHAGTAELNYERKHWGISFLTTYQGERYALNENIRANLVEDFLLFDCSLFYTTAFGRHKLTARLAVNNLTDRYYDYIRFFIMPGRNVLFRLSYEF